MLDFICSENLKNLSHFLCVQKLIVIQLLLKKIDTR